jgi:hypothetical protein
MDSDLWLLVIGPPEVDLTALAKALERELGQDWHDFRTALLIRGLARRLDKATLVRRLPSAAGLAVDPALREAAERNWYIVYGEALPSGGLGG